MPYYVIYIIILFPTPLEPIVVLDACLGCIVTKACKVQQLM